jgi:hypothetical protein
MRVNKSTLAILLFSAALLSGCASPETRLRVALDDAGLSTPVAACMADRMVDRLSLLQLKRLSSLGTLKGQRLAELSMDQFLFKVRALKDAEVLAVTTTSAALCALARDADAYR